MERLEELKVLANLPALHVLVLDANFEKKGNFFVVVMCETPQARKKFRTEVCKNTKEPIFKINSFYFKASSDFATYNPTLTRVRCTSVYRADAGQIQVFEVVQNKSAARLVGLSRLTPREEIEATSAQALFSKNEKVTVVLELKTPSLILSETPAVMGKIALELSFGEVPPFPPLPALQPETSIPRNSAVRLSEGGLAVAKRSFTIVVICGINMPLVGDNQQTLPSPFVTVKTTKEAVLKRPARAATFAANNTRNVIWNERLRMQMAREELEEGIGIFLALIDYSSKKYISKCVMPADELLPGETYNLALVLNNEGGCLLLTVTPEYETPELIHLYTSRPDLIHLEVALKGFSEQLPVSFPLLDLLAVLHLVDDGEAYRKVLRKSRSRSNGGPSLPFYSAQLPDPLEDIPPITSHRVTAPALNPEQQVFRFTNLKKDLLLPKTSLVVEYFRCIFPPTAESITEEGGIVFYGYSIVPMEPLMAPTLADGQPLSLTNVPIYVVNKKKKKGEEEEIPCLSLELRRWHAEAYAQHLSAAQADPPAEPIPITLTSPARSSTPREKEKEKEPERDGREKVKGEKVKERTSLRLHNGDVPQTSVEELILTIERQQLALRRAEEELLQLRRENAALLEENKRLLEKERDLDKSHRQQSWIARNSSSSKSKEALAQQQQQQQVAAPPAPGAEMLSKLDELLELYRQDLKLRQSVEQRLRVLEEAHAEGVAKGISDLNKKMKEVKKLIKSLRTS